LTLGGCGGLLDVSLPGSTPAEALNDPTYANLIVVGVQADFECAASNYNFISALMDGEFIGGQSALALIPYQRRLVRQVNQEYGENDCGSNSGLYSPMAVARFVADDAIKHLNKWTDAEVAGRQKLLAKAELYAGFSYALFGEAWCQAAYDAGPAQTPAQSLALAKVRFTSAIADATASGDAATANAAYVGRARVELQLGQTAEADADAKKVPAGFRLDITRSNSSTRTQNDTYVTNNKSKSSSIDPHFWNLTFAGVADPRTKVTKTGQKAVDGVTDLYTQTKYTSEASPFRLASYTEAQLIIAEVEGGQVAVNVINALHTAAGILATFASTDPATIKAQVIDERRREFFMEGHRMGDLNRVGGWEDAAFGTNPFNGDVYGQTKCFPLPDIEIRNNPNLTGSGGGT
jgi:hypothetical protein